MDPSYMRRIAIFDLNGDRDAVTDAEWIAWLCAALDEEHEESEVLKKRLTIGIQFNMKLLDVHCAPALSQFGLLQLLKSRVGRMLDDLMRVLEQDNQEWVINQESKVAVEVIDKALKPEALKTAVQKQL
ncbi:hypothetical protein H310_10922 [Aphanomyces invadans]|uniref:Uncharacterized protein n=1 Tax=Aphanomyces invadans TaxID=157072 RepID=A0A024TPG2_9STRA|nr:hypothetical protein H310_10922 [Aphanomyces invadans]ETV95884.1 hypothetical protein H310_10922 [Aphanomyces invadans]|eukprot:XP_008875635.1 hypothetical protein H310_10922 [Aphanomyces invadans]